MLSLFLIGFLREEKKFSSLDSLKAQIQADVDTTRSVCEKAMKNVPGGLEVEDNKNVVSITKLYNLGKKILNDINSTIQQENIKSESNQNDLERILKKFFVSNFSIRSIDDDENNNNSTTSSSSNSSSSKSIVPRNRHVIWAKIPL
jgi:hypothetical protein